MNLDEKINWIARDMDGELWGYENKPTRQGNLFFTDIDYWYAKVGHSEKLFNVDFTNEEWESLNMIKWENEEPTHYIRSKKRRNRCGELEEENLKLKNEISELKKPKWTFDYDESEFNKFVEIKNNELLDYKNKIEELEKENLCLNDNNNTLATAHSLLTIELEEKEKEFNNYSKVILNSLYGKFGIDKLYKGESVKVDKMYKVIFTSPKGIVSKPILSEKELNGFLHQLNSHEIRIDSIENFSYLLGGGQND